MLLAASCSLTEPPSARFSIQPALVSTKYHLRQDGTGSTGSDFFPWDIGSLKSNFTARIRGTFDLGELLPMQSEVHIDYSKVDAAQAATLDPSRTWIWNGSPITTFDSQASFDRTTLGMRARSPLTNWMDLRYGLAVRRFLFDGDIVTDVSEESFDFESFWLSPEIGVTLDLPWDLTADAAYSGFMQPFLRSGSDVQRPYGLLLELRRDFGRFGLAAGYELDHVELERPLGAGVEFAHLRLRTAYLAIELDF